MKSKFSATIIHITDTHYAFLKEVDQQPRWQWFWNLCRNTYNLANNSTPIYQVHSGTYSPSVSYRFGLWLSEYCQGLKRDVFLIHSGDLAASGVEADLHEATRLFEDIRPTQVSARTFLVPGNHDFYDSAGYPTIDNSSLRYVRSSPSQFHIPDFCRAETLKIGSVDFILLSLELAFFMKPVYPKGRWGSAQRESLRGRLNGDQVAELRQLLAQIKSSGARVIAICHYPLLSPMGASATKKFWHPPMWPEHGEAICELLRGASGDIFLSGHLHQAGVSADSLPIRLSGPSLCAFDANGMHGFNEIQITVDENTSHVTYSTNLHIYNDRQYKFELQPERHVSFSVRL